MIPIFHTAVALLLLGATIDLEMNNPDIQFMRQGNPINEILGILLFWFLLFLIFKDPGVSSCIILLGYITYSAILKLNPHPLNN